MNITYSLVPILQIINVRYLPILYALASLFQEREDLNQKVLDFDNMKKKLAKFTLVEKALEVGLTIIFPH